MAVASLSLTEGTKFNIFYPFCRPSQQFVVYPPRRKQIENTRADAEASLLRREEEYQHSRVEVVEKSNFCFFTVEQTATAGAKAVRVKNCSRNGDAKTWLHALRFCKGEHSSSASYSHR